MTEPPAAQEDQLILPAEWRERLMPRRGNGVRRPVDLDPDALANVKAQIEKRSDDLVAAFERPESDAELGKAALAHLGGAPNPIGAGALLTVLRFTERYKDTVFQFGEQGAAANRELFTALVIEFGLAFAVSAAIEDMGTDHLWVQDTDRTVHDLPSVQPGPLSNMKWRMWTDPDSMLPLARTLIAAADEEEYRRIVSRASEHRGSLPKRLAAAILLPDELDWVADVCGEPLLRYGAYEIEPLVWSVIGTADHLKCLGAKRFSRSNVRRDVIAELVANLGTAALPLFATAMDYSLTIEQCSLVAEATALLPSDAAAELLVRHGGKPAMLAAFQAGAVRFPHRYARAVAARISEVPSSDMSRLSGAFRQVEIPLDSVLGGLSDVEQATLERLLAESALPVASLDELPEVLVSPPWAARPKRRAAAPIDGLEAPRDIAIVWGPGEYERAMAIEPYFAEWDEDEYWSAAEPPGLDFADALWGRLARGGAGDADAIAERMRESPKYAEALVPIRSATAAALAADWFTRLKSARVHGIDWLDRHGQHAVALLLPLAFGTDKKRRLSGEAALRYLGRRIGDDIVARATESHGAEAMARVRTLLDTDPNVPFAGPPSKPGAWADVSMLPPVALRGGAAMLPAESIAHLIDALALWSPRVPFPGVDAFAAHCDRDSLRRFSQALFELWLHQDAPSKDSWAVDQLACFGDDSTVASIAPLIATWPGHSQTDRAIHGLEVLAHIGTAAAFTALRDLSRADRFPTVAERARELATRVAAAQGLEFEQLADRLIPDHAITEPGTLTFDYGARRFRLRLDDSLNPHLTDEAGKPRKGLPRPGVRDDEAVAKASIARYKRLFKDVETTAEAQIYRLESAMRNGRTWKPADFRALGEHPIVGSFVKRLVWISGGTAFRVAEDGGFADVHDRDFTPESPIRVGHPALFEEDLPAWSELFRDYHLIQPFEQLNRPAKGFTEEVLATGRLVRFDGRTATMGALRDQIGLEESPRSPEDQVTKVWRLARPVPGGWLLADVAPSPDSYNPDPFAVLALSSTRLMVNRNRHPEYAEPLPGSRVDPVAAAELIGSLEGVTA
jgi:hypothetical protein